jgi:hypothetical protein
MDKGIVEARRRTCMECPHRRTAHASVWRWHHCTFAGAGLSSIGEIVLSPEFFEGGEGICPAGKWSGLQPVDLEAERLANEAQARERSRTFVTPYLDAALKRIPDPAEKGAFLVELVAAGKLRRDLADERAVQEGLLAAESGVAQPPSAGVVPAKHTGEGAGATQATQATQAMQNMGG